MPRIVDTLPPADRDELLPFEGYFNHDSHCRMRLYRSVLDGNPVIVLTELPDNPGTSITNRAERAHYLAWRRIGSPEGGLYCVEHYPGRENGQDPVLDGERLDWVQFDEAPDGSPVLGELVIGRQTVGMEFQHPEWKRLPREEFDRLIGAGRPQ